MRKGSLIKPVLTQAQRHRHLIPAFTPAEPEVPTTAISLMGPRKSLESVSERFASPLRNNERGHPKQTQSMSPLKQRPEQKSVQSRNFGSLKGPTQSNGQGQGQSDFHSDANISSIKVSLKNKLASERVTNFCRSQNGGHAGFGKGQSSTFTTREES